MSVLYADTSALVKLYVDEAGSDEMVRLVSVATDLASSVLAWADVHATLSRRHREALLNDEELRALRVRFTEDFGAMTVVGLDGRVLELVERIVRDHALRGGDAVHLASAVLLAEEGVAVRFACSDRALIAAARAERLDAIDPATR